ncbi:MAG: VOC family protein [Gammaproteobacteria bacterium]|nr:VOC family protein [Gammaproteobacteria bacterium]
MSLIHYGLHFHHFGLAVRDTASAVKVLKGMGYAVGEQIQDPLQNVMLIWCDHEHMPAVELVSPTQTPGPLDNMLVNQPELFYHICYGAVNIDSSVTAIRDSGVRILTVLPPKPAILFDGRRVGFYQIKGFGLIEIVEEA